jgi:hypothetical protein
MRVPRLHFRREADPIDRARHNNVNENKINLGPLRQQLPIAVRRSNVKLRRARLSWRQSKNAGGNRQTPMKCAAPDLGGSKLASRPDMRYPLDLGAD